VRSFDAALELAEEILLQQRAAQAPASADANGGALRFLESAQDQRDFASYLETVRLQPGQTLFHEGQACDETYFVESGRLDVVKMGVHQVPVRLAKVVAGSMIGEIALYSGRPRGASVIAVEPAQLRMLTRQAWERMKRERPALASRFDHHVILSLANTVGRANAALSLLED
jgi:CRP-like cAMP-binding protein